jgi:hypothetical protein
MDFRFLPFFALEGIEKGVNQVARRRMTYVYMQ